MNKLKNLQTKKLLKQLEFIELEYQYTSEVVSEADTSFVDSLNSFLEKYPDLKDKYNKKLDETIENNIEKSIKEDKSNEDDKYEECEGEEDVIEKDENKEIKEKSKKVKKLYREIVKLTHPDRVKNKEMNDIYIKATSYYDDNDKLGIYKVCNDLKIDYDIGHEDEEFISLKIKEYEKKISFLESTFTWIWFNTKEKEEKEDIILKFINNKIK